MPLEDGEKVETITEVSNEAQIQESMESRDWRCGGDLAEKHRKNK